MAKLSDKDKVDYKALTDKIQSLYINQGFDKSKIPFPMLVSQIKNMMDNNKDYKYSGISYTLSYMVDTLELNLFTEESNGSILSLVPYYYNEARDFYIKCVELKDMADKFDYDDEIRIVKCGSRNKKVEEIDISGL